MEFQLSSQNDLRVFQLAERQLTLLSFLFQVPWKKQLRELERPRLLLTRPKVLLLLLLPFAPEFLLH